MAEPTPSSAPLNAFEKWYSDYHNDACDNHGGIDCTNPKGIAEDAWDACTSHLAPQAVAAQAPAAVAAPALDQYLCQAWGETDLPAVAIVGGLDAVRQFLIDHWLGSPDHQADDGTNMLEEAMVGMQEEWDLEGNAWKWQAQFEIGGVSVQRVDNFSPALPATEDSSAGDLAEPDVRDIEIAGLTASVGHLSSLIDWQQAALMRAKDAMSALHSAAAPINESEGDLDARIPESVFAQFVDEHAALMYAIANSPVAPFQAEVQAEPVAWVHPDYFTAFSKQGFQIVAGKIAPELVPLYAAPQAQPADALDAKRYRWLVGARSEEEARALDASLKPPLPQDEVLGELAAWYLHKRQADQLIDATMAAAQEGGNAATGKDGAA